LGFEDDHTIATTSSHPADASNTDHAKEVGSENVSAVVGGKRKAEDDDGGAARDGHATNDQQANKRRKKEKQKKKKKQKRAAAAAASEVVFKARFCNGICLCVAGLLDLSTALEWMLIIILAFALRLRFNGCGIRHPGLVGSHSQWMRHPGLGDSPCRTRARHRSKVG
jgi:hypothetical protein